MAERNITVEEAALRLGKSPATVRRLLANEAIAGQKLGGTWVVYADRLPNSAATPAAGATPADLDVSRAFKHIVRAERRELWIPDILNWEDFRAAPDDILVAASAKCSTGHADPFEQVEVPKGALLSRAGALLSLADRVAYQALCFSFAKAADASLSDHVFSSRLAPNLDDDLFLSKVQQWKRFTQSVAGEVAAHPNCWVVETDLVSYFETISHQLLFTQLTELGAPDPITRPLRELLRAWRPSNHGLPTGTDASRILGNVFMVRVDEVMLHEGYNYWRYMDDVRIVCASEREARAALRRFEVLCRARGLIVSDSKTQVHKGDAASSTAIDKQFADADYLFKNGLSQAREALRDLFSQALQERNVKKRHARFALARLGAIVDRGILDKMLDRLHRLKEVSPDSAYYLRSFVSEHKVQQAISAYLSGPSEPGLEAFQQAWLISAMLEVLTTPPDDWITYGRRIAWDGNQPTFLRALALNLVVLGKIPSDIQRLKELVQQSYDPGLVRGAASALCRAGMLDKQTQKRVANRLPQLACTIDYLAPRHSLPSLIQEGGLYSQIRTD